VERIGDASHPTADAIETTNPTYNIYALRYASIPQLLADSTRGCELSAIYNKRFTYHNAVDTKPSRRSSSGLATKPSSRFSSFPFYKTS